MRTTSLGRRDSSLTKTAATGTTSAPDARTARRFAFVVGSMFPLLFGLLLPWMRKTSFPVWPWMIMALMIIAALGALPVVKRVYRAWMFIGHHLGLINTRIILAFVFFALVTSMGLLMRLAKRDAMQRRFDPSATTYRRPIAARSPKSMEAPFLSSTFSRT